MDLVSGQNGNQPLTSAAWTKVNDATKHDVFEPGMAAEVAIGTVDLAPSVEVAAQMPDPKGRGKSHDEQREKPVAGLHQGRGLKGGEHRVGL
jgi:hypothetical protein